MRPYKGVGSDFDYGSASRGKCYIVTLAKAAKCFKTSIFGGVLFKMGDSRCPCYCKLDMTEASRGACCCKWHSRKPPRGAF